jgi:kynurenine formamidase
MRTIAVTLALLALLPPAGCRRDAVEVVPATEGPQMPQSARDAQDRPPLVPAGDIVDLTWPLDEDSIFWPTEDGFRLERGPAGVTEEGYFYSANRFSSPEHGGTHLDAPIHFYQDGQTVEQIPLARLIGEGAVVDVAAACEADPDYQVAIDDLTAWESRHGDSLHGRIVLLRTGYGVRWPDRKTYLGTDGRGVEALAELRFPGLHPDAAAWLVRERQIKAVGIDTASIDHGRTERYGSHVALFAHNVPVFENVARLEQLPERGVTVIALPMNIAGGSGAPLRILAVIHAEAR